MNKRRGLVTAVLVAAFAVSAFAQKADVVNAKFVSVDGGFMIDLPGSIDTGVRPVGSLDTGAGTFTWHVPEGRFTVGYVDGIRGEDKSFAVLNEFADSVTATQTKGGGKITERTEFSYNGSAGIQLRIRRGEAFAVNRFILVKNRLYIITADFPRADGEPAVNAILDSFEVIDSRSLVA
jgi:hypothetical protein